MTWQEFKQAMHVLGVKDQDELWYIDVGLMLEIKGEQDAKMGWKVTDAF